MFPMGTGLEHPIHGISCVSIQPGSISINIAAPCIQSTREKTAVSYHLTDFILFLLTNIAIYVYICFVLFVCCCCFCCLFVCCCCCFCFFVVLLLFFGGRWVR